MADTPSTASQPRAPQRQNSTIEDGWCNSSATSLTELRNDLIRNYDPDTKCVSCDKKLELTEFEHNERPGATTTLETQDPAETEVLLGCYGLRCGLDSAVEGSETHGCGRPICFGCANLVGCVSGHAVHPSGKEVREIQAAKSLEFCFGNSSVKNPKLKPGRTFWHPALTEQRKKEIEKKGVTCSRLQCPNPKRLVSKPRRSEGKDYEKVKKEYMAKLYECSVCFAVFCKPCGEFLKRLAGREGGCKEKYVQHFKGFYRKKARGRRSPEPVEPSEFHNALNRVLDHDAPAREIRARRDQSMGPPESPRLNLQRE